MPCGEPVEMEREDKVQLGGELLENCCQESQQSRESGKSMKRLWTNEPVFSFCFRMSICIVQTSECCVFGASVVLVCELVWV